MQLCKDASMQDIQDMVKDMAQDTAQDMAQDMAHFCFKKINWNLLSKIALLRMYKCVVYHA